MKAETLTTAQVAAELGIGISQVGKLLRLNPGLAVFNDSLGRYMVSRSTLARLRKRRRRGRPKKVKP